MTDDPRLPASAPPPAMPPLGPPYVTPPGRPPAPQYPPVPPTQWPAPPPLLPAPVTPPPAGARWTDRLKRPAVIWGAVAVVMAVLLGALVGRAANDDVSSSARPPTTVTAPRSTTTRPPGSTTAPTTTAPQDLETVVLDIERFVERERGLKFKNKVDVHLAGEGEFQDRLLADFDKDRPGLVESQQVLTAVGLVPRGTDIVADFRSLLEIGVVGFYDSETKQLVVRGTAITPYVREVLAHELTHALDDQWFDLNRPELDNPDDETGFGFLALTEGNARRVENAYLASLSADDQRDAQVEEQQLVLQHPEIFRLPQILLTLLQAPYDDGLSFVDDLVSGGGEDAVNHAFTAPPTTSEQIFEPDKYSKGEGAVAVSAPTAEGTAANVGVLGELLLREMLNGSSGLGGDADQAVTGWGGDRYVTWTDASGASCLRDTFVGDTPTDTSELVDALKAWADDHHGSVNATGGGPATLTVCSG